MKEYSTNLTDKQWQVIKDILEPQLRKRKHSLRSIINAIRPLAVGRKGYLFCDNHISATRAALAYSLISSCKAAGVDPREWLSDVLNKSYDYTSVIYRGLT
ncbi:MAG: hypothetical protein RSC28_04075 [Bacteroidales bacterium]